MFYEVNGDRINEFNQVDLNENPTQITYQGHLEKYTSIYQAFPPIFSTLIGYCIMHPEINLNAFELSPEQYKWNKDHSCRHHPVEPQSCYEWNSEHFSAFMHAFGPPLVGYLVGVFLWQSAQIIACTTNHERSFNKETNPCKRIAWNVMFTQNKLSCPPSGTIVNSLATTFLSSATTVVYALLGAQIFGLIPDRHAAADLTATHAVGGAVIPALVTSAHIIYRIFTYGELKCCPPPNYYTAKFPTNLNLHITPPSLNCWTSCVSPHTTDISREEVQTAIPVDIVDALVDERQRAVIWARASASLLRPWNDDEEQQPAAKRRATAPMLFINSQVNAGSIGSWTGEDVNQQQQQSQPKRTTTFDRCVIS